MIASKQIDATTGPLIRKIIFYSIPLILSTLMQNLFNAVDTAVLGNMADSVAVASVGATGSVVSLIITAFVGISSGVRIVLARFVGEKDPEKIAATVDTSVILAAVCGLVVAVLGWILCPILLQMLDCPADCYEGAVLYLRIYFSAAPAILLYNFCSAIITTAGNSQSPLYYMIAGGVLNVVLNILLCLVLPNKVAAVAIATVASQILGAVLCLLHLCRGEGSIRLQLRKMHWNSGACSKILSMGLPISISNILYPLASLQIYSAVNSFGSSGIAGYHAGGILDNFTSSFVTGIASAGGVFISQNLGAKKYDRVKRSLFHSIWLAVLLGTVIGNFFLLTGRFWLRIFVTDDPVAADFGMIRVSCILTCYGIFGASNALDHFLRSFGYSFINSLTNLLWVLGFRLFWMNVIYPLNPTFAMLMICFPLSWVLIFLTNIVISSVVYLRFRKGIYRKI
jgi:putative MATE family efflux protein